MRAFLACISCRRAGDSSFPRAGRNDPTSAVEKPPPVQTTAPPPLDAAAKAALALPDEHYGGSATCGCGTRPTVVVGVRGCSRTCSSTTGIIGIHIRAICSSEDVDVLLPAMDLASPSLARW